MAQGFPCGSAGKESACNSGDLGSTPGLGRSPEEGKGYALQYSGLEDSMHYAVHGVTKSRTQPSDFHFTGDFPGGSAGKESAFDAGDLGSTPGLGSPLRKGMATHSSVLAWRIPMERGAWWATVYGVTKSQT